MDDDWYAHKYTSVLNKCVILECQNIDLLPEIEKFEKLVTLDMSINKQRLEN